MVVSALTAREESFSSLRELEEGACHELDEVVTIHDELDEELALLEDVIPAPEPESPFALLDDTFAEELEIIFVEELDCATDEDCAASEALDSSIALFSPPSGPELLASSPQAIRSAHAKQAAIEKPFRN